MIGFFFDRCRSHFDVDCHRVSSGGTETRRLQIRHRFDEPRVSETGKYGRKKTFRLAFYESERKIHFKIVFQREIRSDLENDRQNGDFPQIDPKYAKKIEAVVRKAPKVGKDRPDDDAAQGDETSCPYCDKPVPVLDLTCNNCKSNLPFCIVTVSVYSIRERKRIHSFDWLYLLKHSTTLQNFLKFSRISRTLLKYFKTFSSLLERSKIF